MLSGQIPTQNTLQGHGDSRNLQSLKQCFQHPEENGLCEFAFIGLTAKIEEPSENLNHTWAPPSAVSRTAM